MLHEAIGDIDRLERTITELLSISRTSNVADTLVSLADVLVEVESAWRGRFAGAGRSLTITGARYTPTVKGNPAMLRHALDVLIDNALRHGGGAVNVDHTVGDDTVTVTISDDGPGFANESATSTQFDPPTVDGSVHGLGLPLAQRLIAALPGRLTIAHAGPTPRIDIVLQRVTPAAL